ncbi:ead/Ea22-like family protein [Salmonella enterica]|uniref:Ead/Ea22-like family protein n=1 Tax=Salmonella enterica TaxID=28901 RepID=A0A760MQJ9_SALER|nr:ead/Ea22-like family protein [Salmonella enterica]EDH4957128.1 ead/Ea22-like family protein [Salmonella enterica subsp. enterica serovar Poona]EAO1351239.1 ead/Ea22-like family protein [Salmonella enterica]EAP7090124.1 ead/Ea22-like family protein [Salmonella enterica]EAP8561486.1 ead/Ea22-like family protein [Salmonella enterica]
MTIDKQALRETAEKALPAMQRLLMMPNDELFDEAALNVDGDVDAANAFNLLAGPETMLALLDELDKKQQYIKRRDQENEDIALTVGKLRVELEAAKKRIAEQREYYEGVIADGSKRIAELEAKLETADKLQDSAFRDGLKAGFSYGQTDDQSGFAQCMSVYSTRTDIGVKVE